MISLRCRFRIHYWPKLSTTAWLDLPTLVENRHGTAVEYRRCERCGRMRDITTWFDVPDSDLGIPRKMGPLAWARMQEVMHGPRTPLPAKPLPEKL